MDDLISHRLGGSCRARCLFGLYKGPDCAAYRRERAKNGEWAIHEAPKVVAGEPNVRADRALLVLRLSEGFGVTLLSTLTLAA